MNIKIWEFCANIAKIRSSDYPEQVKKYMIDKLIEDKQNEIHDTTNTAVE